MYTTSLPVLIYLDHMIALLFITLCNTNVQILIFMDMTELEIACAVYCICKSSVSCKILVLSILITRSFLLLLSKHLTFHLCRAWNANANKSRKDLKRNFSHVLHYHLYLEHIVTPLSKYKSFNNTFQLPFTHDKCNNMILLIWNVIYTSKHRDTYPNVSWCVCERLKKCKIPSINS